MTELSIIGKRFPRVDAKEKVIGEAKYAADYSMDGMLWCKLLRSPYAHARIINIDTSRAEKLPGVKAVITGKDFSKDFKVAAYRLKAADLKSFPSNAHAFGRSMNA